MKEPPNPPDEMKRIASLRALNILDTPSEERFDRITRLARKSLGKPIAIVSLVDRDRQWFKSVQGLATSETDRAETPEGGNRRDFRHGQRRGRSDRPAGAHEPRESDRARGPGDVRREAARARPSDHRRFSRRLIDRESAGRELRGAPM
jgi:hypothetical protein